LVADFNVELHEHKGEIDRLVKNWQVLLDVMPDMVFLIRDDFVIEYQNRSAMGRFGDLCSQECGKDFRQIGAECRLFSSDVRGAEVDFGSGLTEAVINGVPVEYSAAPFVGYTGAHLAMIVLRDIYILHSTPYYA